MGVQCRNPFLLLLVAVFCTGFIVVAAEEDDMTSWLKLMADTAGSDADPEYDEADDDTAVDSPGYGNSYLAQGGSVGMFVKFPKPQGKSKKITVSKSGKDDFTTINAALDSVAEHSKHRTVIHIRAGVYEEKIVINASKPYITFRGDGQDKTIIQWGDKAGDFDDEDQLLKTYKSATVGVNSQYFIAENIQFRVLERSTL